jgi:putative ABC transport system substrate-binding protein
VRICGREFLSLVGGAVAAWPLAAHAQQPMPVIGYLSSRSAERDMPYLAAIRQGLNEAGYAEGKNVAIEYRWADGQYNRLPALADDLVRQLVVVIVTSGGITSASAAKAATATIPIVFLTGGDPVTSGLVASLNRPGANITGVSTFNAELGSKALQFLYEMVPKATTIALLVNPKNSSTAERQLADLQVAARVIGPELVVLRASTEREIDNAFANLVQQRAGALLIGTDAFFTTRFAQFAALAVQYAVPATYASRQYAKVGGLVSYAPNETDSNRQVGIYAGRILKGEKPADLPVVQATRFELVINLKSAKALGLEIPPNLLALADEVIE